MRPVRNVLPRVLRDEEEEPMVRGRGKKASVKARATQATGAPRLTARGAGKATAEGAARGSSLQPVRRKRPAPVDADSDAECADIVEGPATLTSANHNKYCHFCQHVKVRASSMLACQNQECCRRFCEHCLTTHLSEDVDPMSSCAWSLLDGKPVWHCPICRKKCCCSQADCKQDHRHCKAYRYRRRRAELATKRMSASSALASGEKRVKKSASKDAKAKQLGLGAGALGAAGAPIMRPALNFGFVRSSSSGSSIDSPPCLQTTPAMIASPTSSRPRREAALRGRNYALCDDEDDEEDEEDDYNAEGDNGDDDCGVGSGSVSTPAAGEPDDHDLLDSSELPRCAEPSSVSRGPVCDPQEHVTGDIWTLDGAGGGRLCGGGVVPSGCCAGLPAAASAAAADGSYVDEEEDDQSESLQDADDVLGGIYGHMSQSRDACFAGGVGGDYCGDMVMGGGGVESVIGGGGVGVLGHDDDGDVDGCGGCTGGGADLEEARWIRRTYETVYNPAARQKALQALTSDLNLGGGGGSKSFALPPPGRYPLDEGELYFLSSSRVMGVKTEQGAAAAGVTPARKHWETGGAAAADGSDLFYFLQSHPGKFAGRGDGAAEAPGAGSVRKCTVMYDFQ